MFSIGLFCELCLALLCECGLLMASCLHLAERRMVLLLLHVCTQAQGPADSVSFPSNKRSFESIWCVLLCVSQFCLEKCSFCFLFFVLLLDLSSCSLSVLFPSFALWVFRRLADVLISIQVIDLYGDLMVYTWALLAHGHSCTNMHTPQVNWHVHTHSQLEM